MEHDLGGDDGGGRPFGVEGTAAVEVTVPLREVARGDGEAQPVAGRDAHPDGAERDLVPVDAVRLERRRGGKGMAEAGADDPLLQVDLATGRVDQG